MIISEHPARSGALHAESRPDLGPAKIHLPDAKHGETENDWHWERTRRRRTLTAARVSSTVVAQTTHVLCTRRPSLLSVNKWELPSFGLIFSPTQ